MKGIILFLLLMFIFVLPSKGQNLIPNPSFEDTVDCGSGFGSCPFTPGLCCMLMYWNYQSQTPDYYNRCDTGFIVSVPSNMSGYQNPFMVGNAYVGIFTHAGSNVLTNYRETLGVKFSDSLNIGEKYYVSFKVSLSDSSNCATSNIGVLFSTVPLVYSDPEILPNHAQVFSQGIISDTSSWTVISGSFISDSSYKYFFLGNFFDDTHSDSLMLPVPEATFCPGTNTCCSYYYVDDVCVSTDSLMCAGVNAIYAKAEIPQLHVYPNPADKELFITNETSEELEISIYSVLGNKIRCFHASGSGSVDVSSIPEGLFILEIQNSKNHSYLKSIIIHNKN